MGSEMCIRDRLIIDEMAVNPRYYEKMSELLDALIEERRRKALEYKEYLKRIVELTKKVKQPETGSSYPEVINRPALRALYDNLELESDSDVRQTQKMLSEQESISKRAEKVLALDQAIRNIKKDN